VKPVNPEPVPLRAHAAREAEREQREAECSCKICGALSVRFDMLDFERSVSATPFDRAPSVVPVVYRRCAACGFIFTRFFDAFTPADWAAHIYNDGYADVDPEFARVRPLVNAGVVDAYFKDLRSSAVGLDFGGGNGNTAAALRRAGWAYDCFDPFGANELREDRRGRYDLCSAFEVFEHLPDPAASLRMVLDVTTPGALAIVIGTWLNDAEANGRLRLAGWVYAGPRNGHISLYSRRSLELLATQVGLDFSSLNAKTHIMSRGHDTDALLRRLRWGRYRAAAARMLKRLAPPSS